MGYKLMTLVSHRSNGVVVEGTDERDFELFADDLRALFPSLEVERKGKFGKLQQTFYMACIIKDGKEKTDIGFGGLMWWSLQWFCDRDWEPFDVISNARMVEQDRVYTEYKKFVLRKLVK